MIPALQTRTPVMDTTSQQTIAELQDFQKAFELAVQEYSKKYII